MPTKKADTPIGEMEAHPRLGPTQVMTITRTVRPEGPNWFRERFGVNRYCDDARGDEVDAFQLQPESAFRAIRSEHHRGVTDSTNSSSQRYPRRTG